MEIIAIKQETSKHLRRKYAIIRQTRETDDFWATGYYCGTAGHISADQVARYILEQTQKSAQFTQCSLSASQNGSK